MASGELGERAWAAIGRRIEAEHPGWKLTHQVYGYTAAGHGRVLGPAGMAGIKGLISAAEGNPQVRQAGPGGSRMSRGFSPRGPGRRP